METLQLLDCTLPESHATHLQSGNVPVDNVRRSDGPTLAQWQQHRPTIELLRNQDMPLKEITEIMKDVHGFTASERMYKQRFKKWGLNPKYLKAEEMFAAAEIIERRRLQGKRTQVTIRGMQIDEVRIQKFTRRNGRRPANAKHTTIPSTIRCCTPDPKCMTNEELLLPNTSNKLAIAAAVRAKWRSVRPGSSSSSNPAPATVRAVRHCHPIPPKSISDTSEAFEALETNFILRDIGGPSSACFRGSDQIIRPFTMTPNDHLLANIQRYYRNTYFHSSSWKPWSSERFCEAPSPYPTTLDPDTSGEEATSRPTVEDPSQIIGSIEIAVRLFDVGNAGEAGFLLNQACDKFQTLLHQQHPQLLTTLLLLTTMLGTNSPPRLFEVLMMQLYNMAQQVLHPDHPVTNVISALARIADSSGEVLDRAFNVIADEYCSSVGAFHPQHLEARNIHAWSLLRRRQLVDADHHFSQLRDNYEQLAGSLNLCTRKTLYGLAQVHLAQQDLATTESVLLDVQRRTEMAFGEDAVIELKIECLRLRASLYKRMAMDQEMKTLTLKAYEFGRQLLEPYHPTMLLLEQEMISCVMPLETLDEGT